MSPRSLCLLLILSVVAGCADSPSRGGVPPDPGEAVVAGDGEGEGEAPAEAGEGEGEPPAEAGEGEGEPPAEAGEGEGEPPVEAGEGEGEPPVEQGEGEGEPADPCPAMHRDLCIDSVQCVLEQPQENGEYVCRRAVGDCERTPDGQACEDKPGCEWFGGACYCPDGLQCFCGGGPPPICRPRAASCELRVRLRHSGGLCEDGACFDRTEILGSDYITFDDQTARTPLYAQLPPDRLAPIDAALAQTAALDLAEGYGQCCNAHFDGSDAYVVLVVDGVERPEVRVSEADGTPAPLRSLIDLLGAQGRALLERNAEGPRCMPD